MKKLEPTMGLEVHAELATRTKMFCDCKNDPDERNPNVNTCPVCLGHPGALPTINKSAVEAVIKVGLALHGTINPVTKFDRKNYFYPDLPKGYQISQYDQPLVEGGSLLGIRITRIHLEEDVGRSQHAADGTVIDFNRSSIPLMELVTEPDFRSADEVVAFARELQLILRTLHVSNADMEKGNMRIEVNISLNMGTKVECKNINSFKAVHDAIHYEVVRQKDVLTKGEKVLQETRGWNEAKKATFSQRLKEDAHDYRYFPEPDLPPFETVVFNIEDLKRHLPELPTEKRERLKKEFGLSDAQTEILVFEPYLANFFEEAVSELAAFDEMEKEKTSKKSVDLLFNYLTSDLRGLENELKVGVNDMKVTPERLAHLVDLIEAGKIGSRQAKDILRAMVEEDSDPEEIMTEQGLETVSDDTELLKTIDEVIAENPSAVADYKKGKTASVQFMIGKAMAKLRGRGAPDTLRSLFEDKLK